MFSGGIITLSVAAAAVIVAFAANYNQRCCRCTPSGSSFTLSQAGMTRHHLRLREPGWRYGMVQRAGGAGDLRVLLDIIQTKFTAGAWMVLLALLAPGVPARPDQPCLRARAQRPQGRSIRAAGAAWPRHEVVVFLDHLDRAALGALPYARQLNPLSITALHVAADPDAARRLAALWAKVRCRCHWRWSTARTATWSPRGTGRLRAHPA